MTFETLKLTIDDGLAHLVLNRPEAMNTIGLPMAAELLEVALRTIDPDVDCLLISGAGRAFCGGGDLKEIRSAPEGVSRRLRAITSRLHAAMEVLADGDAPIVAAVHGAAAGAGLSMAAFADVVVAEESTRFLGAYTKLGLSPDGGATHLLPRLVGLRRAQQLYLTSRALSAAEALDWGLISRVVPDGDALGEAQALARDLAAGPTAALGHTRRLLATSFERPLAQQLAEEARALSAAGATADAAEGVAAFVEKRPPRFG